MSHTRYLYMGLLPISEAILIVFVHKFTAQNIVQTIAHLALSICTHFQAVFIVILHTIIAQNIGQIIAHWCLPQKSTPS